MKIRRIEAKDDAQVAVIIRKNLKDNHLDIPGTVYFDSILDHLSAYYNDGDAKHEYYVMVEETPENEEKVIGCVGLEAFGGFESCAELQKIYLDSTHKGLGLGRTLLEFIENRARELGYRSMYLETHTNLAVAIAMYRKHAYLEIERPSTVQHGAMNVFLMKEL